MPPKSRTGAAKKVRRKERKNVAHGHAHIRSTFNNTIVSDHRPGRQRHLLGVLRPGRLQGIAQVDAVRRRRWRPRPRPGGPWSTGCARSTCSSRARLGPETAIRSLQATGLEVGSIQDVTPVPHNELLGRRSGAGSEEIPTDGSIHGRGLQAAAAARR